MTKLDLTKGPLADDSVSSSGQKLREGRKNSTKHQSPQLENIISVKIKKSKNQFRSKFHRLSC